MKKRIKKMINELVSDLVYLNSELSIWNKGSFIYVKIELAYAITELKIEVYIALLRIVKMLQEPKRITKNQSKKKSMISHRPLLCLGHYGKR